jgi:CyaY protein
MTESEFLDLAEKTLDAIEGALETAAGEVDIECSRSGNVLEVEFVDNGSKIIINSQAAMQEIWVAARAGGFHFKREGQRWLDTRNGGELFESLSALASGQGGQEMTLRDA